MATEEELKQLADAVEAAAQRGDTETARKLARIGMEVEMAQQNAKKDKK